MFSKCNEMSLSTAFTLKTMLVSSNTSFNRPFYRYGGYIELIWFKEYYRHSFENEALENKDRSTQILKTKHPNLENEAPKTQKWRTQKLKTKHPKLETCLSFKNTRQSLVKSPAPGIKHDNK